MQYVFPIWITYRVIIQNFAPTLPKPKRLELEQNRRLFIITELIANDFTKYEDVGPFDTDCTGFFEKSVLIWDF